MLAILLMVPVFVFVVALSSEWAWKMAAGDMIVYTTYAVFMLIGWIITLLVVAANAQKFLLS